MQEVFETLTKYKMLAVNSPSGVIPSLSSSISDPRPESAENYVINPTTTNYSSPTTGESSSSHNMYNIYSPIGTVYGQDEPADLSLIGMQNLPISAASTGAEEPANLSLIGMEDLLFNNEN
ncbi:hypothetical protein O0L34_g9421 [Tuta absoluta]|nr:hypothetical protein O0L34_g9421 [Tuta absoluta]